MASTLPPLTLVYFPFPGRAASIQDALAIGRIPYERETVLPETWPALRDSGALPWGGLPVLKVGGESPADICQSDAILRWVGGHAGLYPTHDSMAALKVDQVLGCVDDMLAPMSASIREPDPARRAAIRADMAANTLPRDFERLEWLLQANVDAGGSPTFFVGDDLTVADLKVLHSLDKLTNGSLDGIPVTILAPFIRLNAWREDIRAVRAARLA